MSLRDLISRSSALASDQVFVGESEQQKAQDNAHWALETALHEQLINRLDLETLAKLPKE